MPVSVYIAQAVLVGSKAYIGGRILHAGSPSDLLVYDFTKDLWDILDTPTEDYALTTYHSQLVLVGGIDPNTEKVTNELWVLDEQHHWTQPFPPMATERCHASAVSAGDHLIVAGGCRDGSPLATVEVYDGHQWRQVQSLPKACYSMKSALLEGNWYLAGGMKQGRKVYYTSLECLIATSEEAVKTSVWKKLPNIPLESSTLAVLSNQLITLEPRYYYNPAIHVYSPNKNFWVHVGEVPVACYSPCTLALSTGELLVVGTRPGLLSCLFKANIGETSFPDGHFDMSTLDRLEKTASISIFKKLVPKFLSMASALCFDEPTLDGLRVENNPVEGVKEMMKAWLLGENFQPPMSTWQVLLEKLQAIDMGELAQEIEHFFNTTPVTSPSTSLISDGKKEELELDLSAIEKKEQQTKPDCREAGVQTHGETSDCREAGVQTHAEVSDCREAGVQTHAEVSDCREAGVQTHAETTASEITGYLRGVDVIAETSVLVTNQSQAFRWAGYGLKLHIPQGALPTGLKECRLLIKVGLSGQFALPQNTSLVSAVYWLDSEPRLKFSQPLTLEIQHCAKSSQTSKLSFALAKCSERNLPYTFDLLKGGEFSSLSAYGCIQLSHFSLVTLVKRLILGEDDVSYRASLYYLKKGLNHREIHFVITKDQEAHVTVVQQEYTAKGATIGLDHVVEFESETISLQLPSEGITLENGWKIVPNIFPMITKKEVDSFRTGRVIPSCQLTAVWTKQDKQPSLLIHQVTIEGAKKPFNFFHMVLDCDSISPTGLHTKYPAGLNSQPELSDLMNEVAAEIPSKWRSMGLQLGVDHSVLEGIALISPGDINHCYSNVFTRWKNQNSTTYSYTWSTIVQALESRTVGEKRLADKIKNELTPQ